MRKSSNAQLAAHHNFNVVLIPRIDTFDRLDTRSEAIAREDRFDMILHGKRGPCWIFYLFGMM